MKKESAMRIRQLVRAMRIRQLVLGMAMGRLKRVTRLAGLVLVFSGSG